MDAIDILGALLGRKGQPTRPSAPNQSAPKSGAAARQSSDPFASARAPRPMTIDESAASLEELLGVASDHHASRRANPSPKQTPAPMPAPMPKPAPVPSREPVTRTATPQSTTTRASLPEPTAAPERLNEQAKILIRAMIAAAKADGQITEDEQSAILQQMGHAGPAEIDFLRKEFSSPLDVRDIAWSVPMGLEEQAYTISLMAIRLDEQSEATYLGELAHGLRLPPQRCNEIHRKLGAPEIFR